MALPEPLPQTLREAVWSAIVAILLATRFNDIAAFVRRLWFLLRESSATAQVKAAEAHKTDAEAEAIEASTMISLMREMRVSMSAAKKLEHQLTEQLASKESIINLQQAELDQWRARHPDEVRQIGGKR